MKYLISWSDFDCDGAFYPITDYYTDSALIALYWWYRGQQEHPTCCDIGCYSKEDANHLREVALQNADKLAKWEKKFHIPYKHEYIMDSCEGEDSGFLGTEEFPDMVFPFSVG